MEWERARKKTPFGVRRKLVSSFLSLMRCGKEAVVFRCLYSSPEKPGQIVPPIFALQMFLRSRSAVCAALFGTAGFPIHQYPPGSLSKNNCALCAWCGISQCTPSSPGRYRNPPFRIVNHPQPSGQPSKIPQLQFFPLRAAIQIVFLIVDKGRGIAFPTGL